MTKYKDILAALVKYLRTLPREIEVQTQDVEEGFSRPSFFIELDNIKVSDFMKASKIRDITVRIVYFPKDKHKIILLKEWKRNKPLFKPSVADPIGHNLGFFSDTFTEIHSEIKRILPFIFAELKKFITYNEIKL